MLRLLIIPVLLMLAACGDLSSPNHPPISFGTGPTVWKYVGNLDHRCKYDGSIPARAACLDQEELLKDAVMQLHGRRNRWWNKDIDLYCDAGHGTAPEIRACTAQYRQTLEGYPWYLNFDRPRGTAPRVLVPRKKTRHWHYRY